MTALFCDFFGNWTMYRAIQFCRCIFFRIGPHSDLKIIKHGTCDGHWYIRPRLYNVVNVTYRRSCRNRRYHLEEKKKKGKKQLLELQFFFKGTYMYNLQFVTQWQAIDIIQHPSEIRGLCLIKWPSETLQNLLYFWNMKTHLVFFHFVLLYFSPNECPGLCQQRPGHSLGCKIK